MLLPLLPCRQAVLFAAYLRYSSHVTANAPQKPPRAFDSRHVPRCRYLRQRCFSLRCHLIYGALFFATLMLLTRAAAMLATPERAAAPLLRALFSPAPPLIFAPCHYARCCHHVYVAFDDATPPCHDDFLRRFDAAFADVGFLPPC